MKIFGAASNAAPQSRRAIGLVVGLLAAAGLTSQAGLAAEPPEQTGVAQGRMLIRGGLIVDGSGSEPYPGDIELRGDRISAVAAPGALAPTPDTTIIEAAGRVVAPGFIDPHSHGDPFATPRFENFLSMGVTTITLGQDGSSPPGSELEVWQRRVEAAGIAPNLALFVGHGSLRQELGIGNGGQLSSDQLARLEALLDRTLTHSFGLSTGLEYTPGLYAQTEELTALAKVVGRRGRVIMSHLRNEDDDQLEASLEELFAQGRYCRVHVAHLKSVYGKGAARGREILSWIQAARRRGIAISADVYPYSASYTGLALLFPTWAKSPEDFARAKLERREALEAYLRDRVQQRNGPEATVIGTEPYRGVSLAALAERLNKPFEQVLVDDLGPAGHSAAYFVMNDELQEALLADHRVAISSDGSPTAFHPRGHGTHAKVIDRSAGGAARDPRPGPAAARLGGRHCRIRSEADPGTSQLHGSAAVGRGLRSGPGQWRARAFRGPAERQASGPGAAPTGQGELSHRNVAHRCDHHPSRHQDATDQSVKHP